MLRIDLPERPRSGYFDLRDGQDQQHLQRYDCCLCRGMIDFLMENINGTGDLNVLGHLGCPCVLRKKPTHPVQDVVVDPQHFALFGIRQ
mmetsp:Transcript_3327/g.7460  ORF Transcript_3327/g.7460 Transcript_3327/m.7460 type:complete len:89 (-) Transcript_3327:1799-2065(-)